MSEERALEYRGDIRAITAIGRTVAWVTQHPQNTPSAAYRLDTESMSLEEIEMPAGAVSILADDKGMWVGGDDSRLYHVTYKGKKPKRIAELSAAATEFAVLPDKRLALICGTQLLIVASSKGDILQTIDLPETATALAADPTGEWLAVGFSDGTVAVFDCEEKDSFLISESEKLHSGAVTALLFQAEELRFFSAGADKKLFLTHARGTLEPEDRGRSNNHTERVTSMLLVPGDRFITGSRDKTCKTWARSGAAKPATQKDGISAVVDMALCEIHGRTQLAIACSDNSVRFFLIDASGRFGADTLRITDAYSRAQQLLTHRDAAQRGQGMTSLAEYDDNRSVEMLATHIHDEDDHKLRVRATELLCKSNCPLSAKLLEPLLKTKDMVVRETAFAGLCNKATADDLEPMQLGLDCGHHNVGTLAIKRLTKLAAKDEIANQMVVRAISHKLPEVRIEAQLNLESLLDADSPEANLTAIASKQADSRTLGLVRLYQRNLLDGPRVQAAIRRAYDDSDPHVRMHAFVISVLKEKKLSAAIRFRSEELHRQFHALETIGKNKSKAKELPKAKKASADVPANELDPLLTAMASRATDTALRGATCLALLGDARSLGMLLQLSREEDAKMRSEVCLALAELGDSRATDRLETMLDDHVEQVRDAAFTAFTKLASQDPLEAPESGLASAHADVRRRALNALVAFMRKSAKNKKQNRARNLLVRALNDSETSVRNEAFKAVLNVELDGGGDKTLRFVLGSVHADIRREVLTEVMASDKADWAEQLLRELFSDPDVAIRSEAFEHAIDKTKRRDVEPMQFGLRSAYPDIRLAAVKYLIELATSESQALLSSAVSDDDAGVRQAVLEAIVDSGEIDTLKSAMKSPHDDVRLTAACSLAVQGNDSAREVLVGFATAKERDSDEDWMARVIVSLQGLANLGDSSVAFRIAPLLKNDDGRIVTEAVRVFAGFLDASGKEQLHSAMKSSGTEIQVEAALGLAICCDSAAMPVVFNLLSTASVGNHVSLLQPAILYGDQAETRLIAVMNDSKEPEWTRNAALITMLARDLLDHDGTPRRAISCLSTADPRVRLFAARAVESFIDRDAFLALIVHLFNHRGDQAAWEIDERSIQEICHILVFGDLPIRDRLIRVLKHLDQPKQDQWDQHFGAFRKRFAASIASAVSASKENTDTELDLDELSQIAFGTYVGLVREQGGNLQRGNRPSFGSSVIAIRETAIRRLVNITADDAAKQAAARPVLIQALGDPNQAVRTLAFNQLPMLGIDNDARAFAAIESGSVDLAVLGMQLLTSDASVDTARQVLKDVILSRTDRLANEAAALLADKTDRVEAAEIALNSRSESLRKEAVLWLTQDYDDSPKARKLLHEALQSKHVLVRLQAAIGLADKRDNKALEALVKLLQNDDSLSPYNRYELEEAFRKLGDPSAANAMMDRIQNDPEKTARVGELFTLVSEFRNSANVDRLLSMMEHKPWRSHASSALLAISGFDQPIYYAWEEQSDYAWLEKQHPRNDEVLAKLLQRHLDLESSARQLIELVRDNARWSQSHAVDDVLGRLASHTDDALRWSTLAAIGWRLKHRDGPAAPLIAALESRDPRSKLIAADGLARSGRNDGIAVLMSAVELASDIADRASAVEALGMLGDPRSLELLLRLANDNLHAMQGVAATAIGNLRQTERADEIFAILKRLVLEPNSSLYNALIGLRHFASVEAWQLLRDHAKKPSGTREIAMVQLSYHDDPDTKDLYLELLGGDEFFSDALLASRRLFGKDSLDPDYATLGAEFWYSIDYDWEHHCAERVSEKGDAARTLELIPNCDDDIAAMLSASLLQRDPLPVEGALSALASPYAATVSLAAHIVGRGGTKSNAKAVDTALSKMLDRWTEDRADAQRQGETFDDSGAVSNALSRLCWAASRTGAAKKTLIDLVQSRTNENDFTPVRVSAISALAEMKLSKADLAKLEGLLSDHQACIRKKVAELIIHDGDKHQQILKPALSDRNVFRTVVSAGVDLEPLISHAIGQPHQQAIVLPHVIRASDAKVLSATANDSDLTDNTRLSAIEALGQVATKDSLKQLEAIGNDDATSEELRKAAWRSYRRSKRIQEKAK